MQIEDFKRWHWALLGLIAGLVFAYAWQDHDVVGDQSYALAEIKQNKFERYALSKSSDSGRAILQNVRVEPPVRDYENNVRQIVTGKRLGVDDKGVERSTNFYYYASVPYEPRLLPPGVLALGKDATVMDYLAVAQKANPQLQYRFAWELENNWSIALGAIGGVVLIGGIWPTVLGVMLGAGLGRPPKSESEKANEEYLKRFGKGAKSEPVAVAKGPTGGDMQRLDEMNAALETQLAAAGIFSNQTANASDGSTAGAVIVPLNSGGDEPAQVSPSEPRPGETEEEFRKRFAAGDFYPVARASKKQ